MPFTFCHPAAVLVLNYLPKRWISLTGLIVGSITPDFEYFIRMQKLSLYSHSLLGLLLFNLPIGVLLAFIYHGIVHKTSIDHLPVGLKRRVVRYRDFDWNERFKRNWPVVLLSVLVGSSTHLLWDGLTLETVNFFNDSLLEEKGAFYYSFWSFNSLIGGSIIVFALYQLPKDKQVQQNNPVTLFWIVVVGISVLIFIFRVLSADLLSIRDYIVSLVTATILGHVVACVVFKYKQTQYR